MELKDIDIEIVYFFLKSWMERKNINQLVEVRHRACEFVVHINNLSKDIAVVQRHRHYQLHGYPYPRCHKGVIVEYVGEFGKTFYPVNQGLQTAARRAELGDCAACVVCNVSISRDMVAAEIFYQTLMQKKERRVTRKKCGQQAEIAWCLSLFDSARNANKAELHKCPGTFSAL